MVDLNTLAKWKQHPNWDDNLWFDLVNYYDNDESVLYLWRWNGLHIREFVTTYTTIYHLEWQEIHQNSVHLKDTEFNYNQLKRELSAKIAHKFVLIRLRSKLKWYEGLILKFIFDMSAILDSKILVLDSEKTKVNKLIVQKIKECDYSDIADLKRQLRMFDCD